MNGLEYFQKQNRTWGHRRGMCFDFGIFEAGDGYGGHVGAKLRRGEPSRNGGS